MKLPYFTKFTLQRMDEDNLVRYLDEVLAIMQEERDFADTHAARNAYRNVARMRLERLREMIRISDRPEKRAGDQTAAERVLGVTSDDIPF